jgi:hypothetical protein
MSSRTISRHERLIKANVEYLRLLHVEKVDAIRNGACPQ